MAAVSCVLSEDQFLCSICLEVFTDPVTTPCGHSFCKICINQHWDSSDQCNCPVCKEDFSTRPQMKLNTCLSQMVSQFKNKSHVEDILSSEPQSAEPGEVDCDVCSEPRLKALKSCLVCLASYCQSHLEPHVTNPRLKRHQLTEPLKNLEDRICPKHDRPLELFCRNDSLFICLQCTSSDHKGHEAVPMKEESEVKQAEHKEMIQDRRLKIEEIQSLVELSQKNADREIEEGVKVFNALMECVQQSLDKFKQGIEEKHKKTEEEAAELIEKIKTELSELEQRRAEMEQLWSFGDHLHFLQTFTSVKPAPELNDWTEETVRAPSYEGRVARAVSELEDTRLHPKIKKFFEAKFKKVQKFAVDVTLDPDTIHPKLVLSTDHKQVYVSNKEKFPDNADRFSDWLCVLGKQKFSSGKFYFETQVKRKTAWFIGVVSGKSVIRNGQITWTPQNGYWFIFRFGGKCYQTNTDRPAVLPLRSPPQKVGVYVDYEEGLISFYDVDNEALMYSLTDCCFTDNILPLFSPCNNWDSNNSAPLILTPVTV